MKTIIGLSIATLALAATSAQANIVGLYGDSKYELVTAPGISWEAANLAVPSGSHLVDILDGKENAFVLGLIPAGQEYWAGGFQTTPAPNTVQNPNSDWNWVTGKNWSYTDWNNGEPNDYYGPNSEQYLGLGLNDGKWNDEGNTALVNGYIIETPVPEPSTVVAGALMLLPFGVSAMRSLRRKS